MSSVKIQQDVDLSNYTSFGVGGKSEKLLETSNIAEIKDAVKDLKTREDKFWLIGYGCNTLISDAGLPGLTIALKGGGDITFEDNSVIVDAGVWWDDLVKASIEKGLWGVELMSEIPGSVGAALFINITAYGQSIGALVEWVDMFDLETMEYARFTSEQLKWSYKDSIFQDEKYNGLIILRAKLNLSREKTTELTYQKAVDEAARQNLDIDNLEDRRQIIIGARDKAGSIWHPNDNSPKTVGSFFRNPYVTTEQAEFVMNFDETGKTKEQIQNMNKVHGGDTKRVSAAHVMLASGFNRGQSWGSVKLNDKNLLKIEASDETTAQEIYDVAQEIISTCRDRTGITLEPEAQILGEF